MTPKVLRKRISSLTAELPGLMSAEPVVDSSAMSAV